VILFFNIFNIVFLIPLLCIVRSWLTGPCLIHNPRGIYFLWLKIKFDSFCGSIISCEEQEI